MDTWWLLLGGCACGALVRGYEEWWRVRVRRIPEQFNREESAQLEAWLGGARFHERAFATIAFVLWPERLLRRLRRRLPPP
jgi:hypothetical protein